MTAQPFEGRYAELTDLLRRRRHLRLLSLEGETAEVPDELADKFSEFVTAMARGQTVTVLTGEKLVSTTKAAEILGVSRQTVVRFIESGRLSFSQPGVHRRLRLSDVLDLRQRREGFHEAMAGFRAEAIENGTYDLPPEEYLAALKEVRRELAGESQTRKE